MAKFILHEPGYGWFFGDANAYSASASGDIRIDFESKITHIQTYQDNPISARYGNIGKLMQESRFQSKVLDMVFEGKKVDEALYQRLCAVAGAMLVAQGQNVLASAGMASNANITIPSVHNEAATLAARQILKPGTPGATLTIISKQLFQVSSEGNNPAIGNWENIEVSMYYGEAVN